jgi:hypothetical protein
MVAAATDGGDIGLLTDVEYWRHLSTIARRSQATGAAYRNW